MCEFVAARRYTMHHFSALPEGLGSRPFEGLFGASCRKHSRLFPIGADHQRLGSEALPQTRVHLVLWQL